MLDILKPEEGETPELAEAKAKLSGVIERQNPEEIAYMKLVSVVILALNHKRDEGYDAFVEKFGEVFEAALMFYRDTVNYGCLKGLYEVPEEGRDITAKLAISLIPSKIMNSEKKLTRLSQELFP